MVSPPVFEVSSVGFLRDLHFDAVEFCLAVTSGHPTKPSCVLTGVSEARI